MYKFSVKEEIPTPCTPSPCGINAVCKERNGAGSCSCIPEYSGNPYVECRPECVLNTDCPRNRACVNNKCVDPCPGTCGLNAECRVVNHSPTCTCLPGYIGNALSACNLPPPSKIIFLFYTFPLEKGWDAIMRISDDQYTSIHILFPGIFDLYIL